MEQEQPDSNLPVIRKNIQLATSSIDLDKSHYGNYIKHIYKEVLLISEINSRLDQNSSPGVKFHVLPATHLDESRGQARTFVLVDSS